MTYEEKFNELSKSMKEQGMEFYPEIPLYQENREARFKEILDIIEAIKNGCYIDSTYGYEGQEKCK